MVVGVEKLRIDMKQIKDRGARPKIGARAAQEMLDKARALAVQRSKAARGEALKLLQVASRMGNVEAIYAIGTWHLYGRHVPKNLAEAARYFTSASRRGYAPAIFDLAVMYETGRGVRKSLAHAFDLYVKAANLGDQDAIKSVARCVYHGIGVARIPALGRLILDRCT
jgi:uncharacterized protein